MPADMFIKIDDIKGESSDDKHKDQIEVLSWSWGVTQSGTMHMGTGGGAGKVNVHDLTFTKLVDKATPNLIRYACNGKHLGSALLTVRKAGGTALEYVKITLSDLIVTSVSLGGTGGVMLSETVTLNFNKVKFEYVPQKTAGGGGEGSIPVGWDVGKNVEM